MPLPHHILRWVYIRVWHLGSTHLLMDPIFGLKIGFSNYDEYLLESGLLIFGRKSDATLVLLHYFKTLDLGPSENTFGFKLKLLTNIIT